MVRRTMATLVVMTAVATGMSQAQEPALTGGLAALEPWIGTWEIETQWVGGPTLWARSTYRPMLGGAFLEGKVVVSDDGSEPYQRYRTIMAWDEEREKIVVHSFTRDGRYSTIDLQVDGRVATSSWRMGDAGIEDRVEVATDGTTMAWTVWTTTAAGERSRVMDGSWHKTDATAPVPVAPDTLSGSLTGLSPLLGGWELAPVADDDVIRWSRIEYRIGLAGRFVDATAWTAGGGYWHPTSETVFVAGGDAEPGARVSFSADGHVGQADVELGHGEAGIVVDISPESAASSDLKEIIAVTPLASCQWQVWVRPPGAMEWSIPVDARWLRQGSATGVRGAVDPGRFVASGGDLRSFVKEAVIPASQHAVWAAWTDPETWQSLWGPPSRARFDLAVGGAYEWLFDGSIGGNGDQILSYIPERMVSFSWNAPPSQPVTRLARTWVVVELEPIDDGSTRVRLTHLGFGEGPEWDTTYDYFDKAWERVLALMSAKLAPAVEDESTAHR